VRILLSTATLEVRLSRWQKLLGLMRDISIPRAHIGEVHVLEDPIREAMRGGLKAGLRLPWLYYACRTINLQEAFIVRRHRPGLSIAVRDHGALTRLVLSTPEAADLAQRLGSRD
jgi:hypothetical protein